MAAIYTPGEPYQFDDVRLVDYGNDVSVYAASVNGHELFVECPSNPAGATLIDAFLTAYNEERALTTEALRIVDEGEDG